MKNAAAVHILPQKDCPTSRMYNALEALRAASPQIKKAVLGACTTCVVADKYVSLEEIELLRAIGISLDCPIPPVEPGLLQGAAG